MTRIETARGTPRSCIRETGLSIAVASTRAVRTSSQKWGMRNNRYVRATSAMIRKIVRTLMLTVMVRWP